MNPPRIAANPGQVNRLEIAGNPGQVNRLEIAGNPGQVNRLEIAANPGLCESNFFITLGLMYESGLPVNPGSCKRPLN